MNFNWINIELTNRCNKACHFCGRAKNRDKMILGDMPLQLVQDILNQFEGQIVQFNKDGEPLLYEKLEEVGYMSRAVISNIVTNGILLWEKRDEIISNFTSLTVSVHEDDEEQLDTVRRFVSHKGNASPMVFIKFLGDYYNEEYEKMGLKTLRRSIHAPEGDTNYIQSKPPVPEVGVCIDFINKPAINWNGDFHICNRYDPYGDGVIGNCNENSIRSIWDSEVRLQMYEHHITGHREKIPFCADCQYWGFPANG